MAKYVRLSEGVFETATLEDINRLSPWLRSYGSPDDGDLVFYLCEYEGDSGKRAYVTGRQYVLKESDKLEDLFDFCVAKDECGKLAQVLDTYEDALRYRAEEYKALTIYGAIDSECGLGYVAKETEGGWKLLWKLRKY